MNWVDVLVILLAALAAISGARQGVVIALPALIGVVAGAVAGIKLAPMVVELFDNAIARVAFAVATVVFLVALGETLGVWAGRKVKEQVKRKINTDKLSVVDSTLGALVQGAVVFVIAWLIASVLTSVTVLPGLASAVNNSAVLGGVNKVMPNEAQGLPAALRKLLDNSDVPAILAPFQRAPVSDAEPPDPALLRNDVVQQLHGSVLKIRGTAPSCSRSLEGSGFVVAPQRVMTNAHVVAGTTETSVETPDGQLRARVVYFDPETDVAILSVPRLEAPPLTFAPDPARAGTTRSSSATHSTAPTRRPRRGSASASTSKARTSTTRTPCTATCSRCGRRCAAATPAGRSSRRPARSSGSCSARPCRTRTPGSRSPRRRCARRSRPPRR